ncbi:MMPL family transporter [Agromyces larvae]|uniref:MMPL family transporter n=1 Tax=Agromyces larvae TaxID=2929802 RepID=A0ABY4BZ49_9MICO|nr:MMPL family transporter [Agromyces larvae]UOE43141.1 MMPL family transporter [Agromyces larvae]
MRTLRVVLPAVVILAWLTLAAVGGPFFGRISEVATNDQAGYLPRSAEATQVNELRDEFLGEATGRPAIVVVERDGGLTDADLAWTEDLAGRLADLDGVDEVSPPIPSEDGDAAELVASTSGEVDETVAAMRQAADVDRPDGLGVWVTGPAGFIGDLVEAFAGIDGFLLLVAFSAVFLILLVVYRSPLLPVVVLATALIALTGSIIAVWLLAKIGAIDINSQVQGILFILVIGAATDYSLLYIARYREALRDHESKWDATWLALRRSIAPIVASGGTVMAGLLCMLLSELNSNRALGPVAAVGIVFALAATLTLLPAVMLAIGRAAFWPQRPKFGDPQPDLTSPDAKGFWPAVARLVSRHARAVWVISTAALLVAGLGVLVLDADGVPQSDVVLGESEARDGQEVIGDHFPAGAGNPALIVGAEADLTALADAALEVDGVSAVVAVSQNSPTGTMPAGTDAPPFPIPTLAPLEPTVVDGQVMLQATLEGAPDSDVAEQAVTDLRDAVRAVDPDALVGGYTATMLDSDAASIHDRTVIIPLVLAVILVILMLLLRSILAPVLLVTSVIVSFAAALGVASVVFAVAGSPGADPAVPLYGFVFLVALGIDYNIFLMTRVREESARLGTRPGILRGLTVTGGVITSAGIVLAATFAALAVIPVLFLVQIAFIVAFGVLLDTLVVRSLVIPALSYDIGPAIWWPSKLWRDERAGRGDESRRLGAQDRA